MLAPDLNTDVTRRFRISVDATMGAGHGCSTRISVCDCFKRPHGCLVGVVRPLCIDDRLQSDHPINPLSQANFVALLKSLPFDGVNQFKSI